MDNTISNIIELASYRDTLADLAPIFEAARNGFAMKPRANTDELDHGLSADDIDNHEVAK